MQGAMAGLLGREGAGSDRLQRRLGGSASLCDLCGPQKALGHSGNACLPEGRAFQVRCLSST